MKPGTQDTIKFKRLQRRLQLPVWQVIGLLESVWQMTARCAAGGDIGTHTNDEIAGWLEYAWDASNLVDALVESGWLERSEETRLSVIEWDEIARDYREPTGRRRDLQTGEWRRLRKTVISEDGAVYSYCGCDCSSDPTVDHVTPFAAGGLSARDNLVVACRSCNGKKGDRDARRFSEAC